MTLAPALAGSQPEGRHLAVPGLSRAGALAHPGRVSGDVPIAGRPEATPTAGECARRIRQIFGDDLVDPPGVLHPVAVWPALGDGSLRVLRTGLLQTPRSDMDRFVLGVARARTDALLTTGRNLRLEPRLTHALWPRRRGGGWDRALEAWRREHLGRGPTRWSVVLTRSGDLDLGHPLFRGPTRVVVFTGEAAARRLEARASRAGAAVVGHPAPDIRAALGWLRSQGIADIAVEAGPTTARQLYDPPLAVDELLLSTFLEGELPDEARGPVLLEPARLEALLHPAGPAFRAAEPSGRWSFRRWVRREGGDTGERSSATDMAARR